MSAREAATDGHSAVSSEDSGKYKVGGVRGLYCYLNIFYPNARNV